MSRSGYSEDLDDSALNLWRGAVVRAIQGKRGQALLRELVQALDEMPEKRLYPGSFATAEGEVCALGALGARRGLCLADLGSSEDDDCDPREVGRRFGISRALAAEIMWLNDEGLVDDWVGTLIEICGPMRPGWPDWGRRERVVQLPNPQAPERRWQHMREWAMGNVKDQA